MIATVNRLRVGGIAGCVPRPILPTSGQCVTVDRAVGGAEQGRPAGGRRQQESQHERQKQPD